MYRILAIIFLTCSISSVFGQWTWAVKSNGTGYELATDVTCDASGNNYVFGNYSSGSAVFGSTSPLPVAGSSNSGCFLTKTNPSGSFMWAVSMGGPGVLFPYANAVTTNGSDIFVTGYFRGTLTFNGTTATTANISGSTTDDECFVARYNAAGAVQWAVKFVGGGQQRPDDIAVSDAKQRIFVTGSTNNKIFIHCYDYSGALLWSKISTNTPAARGRGIVADAAGNSFCIAKYAAGPISLPGSTAFNGSNNMLLVKYDLMGNLVWAKNIGGSGSETPADGIELDGAGNLYIAGEYTQTANISGINLTNNSSATTDLFIAQFNGSGTVQWAKKMGGAQNEYAQGIATDHSGNTFLIGYSQPNNSYNMDCQTFQTVNGHTDNKFFVVKYDNAGNVAWAVAPTANSDQTIAFGVATKGDTYRPLRAGVTKGSIAVR